MNERIKWITHKGKKILFIDQSNLREEEKALQLLDDVEEEILKQPKGHKILTLFYSVNSLVTTAVSDRAKKLIAYTNEQGIPTGPSVIVGTAGFQRAVVTAMQFFYKDIHLANSVEEAKEWLVAQKID